MTNEEFKIEERTIRGMTDVELATFIANKLVEHAKFDFTTIFFAVIETLKLKNKQVKKICKMCERYINEQGKLCPWRSIDNDYCWK